MAGGVTVPKSTMATQSYEGVPGGMNLALPAQSIDDTECYYLQDGLVDLPGIVRRRGPVKKVASVAVLPRPGSGIALVLDPVGALKLAALTGDTTHGFLTTAANDYSSWSDNYTWTHFLPTAPPSNPYCYVNINPVIYGGVAIGTSAMYDNTSASQALAFWMGGNKPQYTPGTFTVARGSTAVTSTGLSANVVPGMFVFINSDEGYTTPYVGVVRSVNSNTSFTLVSPSPYNITGLNGTFFPTRGFAPRVVTGEITTDTAQTQVTGGKTKFISQGLGTGIWQLYRQNDWAYIGKVASVASETGLTLTANAALSLASSPYVAIRADADMSISTVASNAKVGFISAAYADRQWYANAANKFETTYRLWFSDPFDPEAVDMSNDGDWLSITSSETINEPIRALCAAQTGLVILKENESFIVEGTSPSTFSQRKLSDDGCLSGMTVASYNSGVIWVGRNGINYYDGVQVSSLSDTKLGTYMKNVLRTFDPSKYRMWATINRDHYMVFIEKLTTTVGPVKGTVATLPTSYTLVLNLVSQAFSIFTNLNIRGSAAIPASVGKPIWYLVNGQVSGDSSDHGFVCDGEPLFNEESVDLITCDKAAAAGVPGPDFYIESKKFDIGMPLRLKRFRQLAINYLAQGGDLHVDTVVGLNTIGATLTSVLPSSVLTWDKLRVLVSTWSTLPAAFPTWASIVLSVFVPKRVRFMKKTQFFSFRIWQATTVITRVVLGPFELGFKIQRPGRV